MKFYCVTTTVYNNGRVNVCINGVEADEKPQNSYKSTNRADYYSDYFDTLEDAEKFVNDNEY